jgi:RNA ligase (TIGR02306 family)
MSKTLITIERVNQVEHHPNADRLDVVQVLGFKVICGRDQFKVGDAAVYFPADMLIPETIAKDLGVANYLKHTIFPGDIHKTRCRIAACRLRGTPSHGFIVGPIDFEGGFGVDVTSKYQGHKYEPRVRSGCGQREPDCPEFHRYTNIESIGRYPDAIPDGTLVRITEKLHGTNCRLGLVKKDDEFQFMVGSHKVRREPGTGLYSEPLTTETMTFLTEMCDEQHDVVVFGEIYGCGIQDLDYGEEGHAFRVFDISIDGMYMDWADLQRWCEISGIPMVKTLYVGPFSQSVVDACTYGPTSMAEPKDIKSRFKDREGCVITPLVEQRVRNIGRMILKSVSADYRDRKGAKDIE